MVNCEIFDSMGREAQTIHCAWWIGKAAMNSITENCFQLQECSDNCNYRNHEGGES